MLAVALGCARTSWADTVSVSTGPFEGTINGIRGGKLAVTLKAGGEKVVALEEVKGLAVEAVPQFAQAEAVREDTLKAVKAYRELVAAVNKPELRLVAQWRAFEPLDRGGQWVEAVGMFLEVYGASPTEGVWKVRPSHMPGAGSKTLTEAADKVAAAVKGTKGEEARKNLQGWLLEMYTKAGDTEAAARLASAMAPGAVESVAPVRGGAAAGDQAALGEVEAAFRNKDYAGVIKKADVWLATITGETAIQLFAFKAQAQEALGKDEEAAGTWLRIVAHYPTNTRAAEALLAAGRLELKSGHAEEAKVLFREVMEKFPGTKEAAAAKGP